MIRTTDPDRPSFCAAQWVEELGGRFSRGLGINLTSGDSEEIFKWFLASMLFGARISETLAVRAFHAFVEEGLTTPQRIVGRGWDGLVAILDRGGYVRYDFKTASKLLEIAGNLIERYRGDLNVLHRSAASPADLEQRIRSLGKGIGPVTANIFLREMRGVWDKADPLPSELVIAAAKSGGFIPADLVDERRALGLLKSLWRGEGKPMAEFPDFEAALLRTGLAERRLARRKRGEKKQKG